MGEDAAPNRRLAAILAADVVGYSRLMGADEAGTLAALKHHREAVFDPAVAEHKGRVVKLIGDGTLVEFASVVDAVKCALAIQRAVKALKPASGGGITLRIGVNLGDIIIDGDDIYGDGVNVAARLEPLAEPGGICVSSIVNESVGNRIDVAFDDGGEVSVKNIARPIRVWKWHPDNEPAPAVASATKPAAEAGQAGAAVDRGAALRQHVERSRAGIFLRRHHRGHHHRPVQGRRALGHRAQFELRLQGQELRHPHGRTRTRRQVGARRLDPPRRQPGAGSPPSSSTRRAAAMSGRSATTAT